MAVLGVDWGENDPMKSCWVMGHGPRISKVSVFDVVSVVSFPMEPPRSRCQTASRLLSRGGRIWRSLEGGLVLLGGLRATSGRGMGSLRECATWQNCKGLQSLPTSLGEGSAMSQIWDANAM